MYDTVDVKWSAPLQSKTEVHEQPRPKQIYQNFLFTSIHRIFETTSQSMSGQEGNPGGMPGGGFPGMPGMPGMSAFCSRLFV